MSDKRKRYLKLNLVSMFFAAVSFISVTLAWFAYSGLVTTQTEVDVKAWHIEFNKNGTVVSNNIVISLDDVYPGMDIMSEIIKIKNNGDSNAMINYSIKSVRLLDEKIDSNDTNYLEDKLSHGYPFHINMNLSNTFANANSGSGEFTVSVSWPLDSDNDVLDTEWGNKAYNFQNSENNKKKEDASYQTRSSIEIIISLEATQFFEEANAPDPNYLLGTVVLYDVVNNQKCSEISDTCLKNYVLDNNNKYSDSSVTLMPDLYNNFNSSTFNDLNTGFANMTSTWTTNKRLLKTKDLISIISNDIISSLIVGTDISNQIVGFTDYEDRADIRISDTIRYKGYFRFKNDKFTYLSTSTCYWLNDEYDQSKGFALIKQDDMFSHIYGNDKTNSCKIIPVIEVAKSKLNE